MSAAYVEALAAATEHGWSVQHYDWVTYFRKDKREVHAEWDLRGGLIYLGLPEFRSLHRKDTGKRAILIKELTR